MAKAVGSLLVRIGADVGGLRRGGKQSQTVLRKMRKSASDTSVRLAKLGTAATVAGAAITTELTRRGFEAVTSQKRLATSLGTTQRQLAGLTAAFNAYKLEQNDVADALGTLTDRALDAANGQKSMAEDFSLVGIEVDNLKGKKPAELFRQFSQAVKDTEDPSKRTAAAVRIFGDDLGRKVLPLLMRGPDALREFQEQADALGTSVSSIDAAQIEKADRAMAQIGQMVAGVQNQLAVQFAPIIEAVSNHFTSAAKEAGGMGSVVEKAFNKGIDVAVFMANAVDGVRRTFELAGKGVALFASVAVRNFLWAADAVINGPIKAVNELITLFNKVPGIDIEPVGLSGLGKSIKDQYAIANQAVLEAEKDMSETISKPLAGERLRAFIEEARAGAEELSGVAQNMATGGGQEGAGDGTDKKSIKEKLERIREANMSEIELLREKHNLELEEIKRAREAGIEVKQGYDALVRETEKRHQDELTKAVKNGNDVREKFERASMSGRVSMVAGFLQKMTQSVASENKKMFEINKAASIAQALVNAYESITGAYKYGANIGGPILGGVFAAAASASQLATVAAIKSQTFSGSGSTTAPSATPAGSGAASGSTPTHSGGGQEVSRSITIRGEGLSQSWVRDELVPALNDAVGDGARFNGG